MEDLGYLQIKQIIASYAKSCDAKEQILMTVPFESKEALQEELNVLDAFFKAEELGLDADFFTPLTTEDTFLKLSKGEILYLKGLLMIERELELVEGVKEVFKEVLPALKEKVEGMTSFTSLRENLKRTIKNEEELYPDASPLLRQLKSEEKKLLNLFKSGKSSLKMAIIVSKLRTLINIKSLVSLKKLAKPGAPISSLLISY